MLIDIKPRRRKPVFGTIEIDWAHPLSMNLVACWVMNSNGGLVLDLVGSNSGTITDPTNTKWAIGSEGLGLQASASASTTKGVTIPGYVYDGSSLSWDTIITPSASTELYGALLTAASSGIYFTAGSSRMINWFTTGDHTNSTAITLGTTHHYVMTLNSGGTSGNFYLDGRPDGNITALSNPLTFTGMFNTVGSFTYDGFCYFQRLWKRTLTAQEALWLAVEPYAFLRPKVAITYSFMRTVTAAATTVFRRTLSAHGTRTGSRQVHF